MSYEPRCHQGKHCPGFWDGTCVLPHHCYKGGSCQRFAQGICDYVHDGDWMPNPKKNKKTFKPKTKQGLLREWAAGPPGAVDLHNLELLVGGQLKY